jgi:hypothetical protein
MLIKNFVVAVALLGAVGCNNGQPRLYLIAIDQSNMRAENLPQNCFKNPQNPQTVIRSTYQNVKNDFEWAIWDGVEGKQFLDGAATNGRAQWKLGEAPPFDLDYALIESVETNAMFRGTKTISKASTDPNFTSNRIHSIQVKFDELGMTARGTLDLQTAYTCSGTCPDTSPTGEPEQVTCSASLPFTGRRIDTARQSFYNENP